MNKQLSKKIDTLLEGASTWDRHSEFQIMCFILGKEPTNQGKLQQCLREIKTRKEALFAINLELEELKDQRELISIDLEILSNKITSHNSYGSSEENPKKFVITKRQYERKIAQMNYQLEQLEEKIINTEEELAFFVKAFESLSKEENLKNWDTYDVQMEYWNAKFSQEVYHRSLLGRPVDLELFNSILALPDATKIKQAVITKIQEESKLLERSNGSK